MIMNVPTQEQIKGINENLSKLSDYSTTEKAIGKWIDGKTLYCKTIDCGSLPNSTTKNIQHNIDSFGAIVSVDGIAIKSSNGNSYPIPFVPDQITGTYNIAVLCTSTLIQLVTHADFSAYNGYVTIKYTKA